MTPSTASCTLWTMNPSCMSYRDHGKPHLASFRIRISTLLGPILTIYLSMTVLQDLSITQLWNVLLHHFCRVVWSCLIAVLLPVCRAFEPAEGSYLIRMLRSRDLSRHGRDAECNSTPRSLVDFIILRVLTPTFGPRTWSRWIRYRYRCGYHPLTSSLS